MMKSILTLVAFLLSFHLLSQKEVEAVKSLMNKQQQAWNKFDLEGFMEHYWKSDSLKFIGSRGLTYGWQKTLDNYKKSYPTSEAMGQLVFDINSAEALSSSVVYVIGKWTLHKKEKDVGGYFTLLWKKINKKWVIVADHTS
ncbi:MAG: nuclear transport factor 2 family protein [Bacteroidetes bacterium]|nr:nuclear transport factor 2 family protein [Bacteroidota bacterium]